jgi:hypothetical protein
MAGLSPELVQTALSRQDECWDEELVSGLKAISYGEHAYVSRFSDGFQPCCGHPWRARVHALDHQHSGWINLVRHRANGEFALPSRGRVLRCPPNGDTLDKKR